MMRHLSFSLALAAVCCAPSARAAIMINEVFVNPPGTDDTQEFIELKSSTGGVESLAGLHLLVIDGDTTSAGVVDVALNLGAFSTGSNGLFLWRANTAVGSISPAADPATSVNTADFNPDLENGANTFLLVRGFLGMVGGDLDTDNDGVLDSTPWSSVVDAIGIDDNDVAADRIYGAALGFTNFGTLPSGFDNEVILRQSDTNQWIVSDISGTNPGGPYTFDGTESQYADGSTVPVASLDFDDVSPGSVNPKLVPEPASLALLIALVAAPLAGRRRS